jgi:hypothetical protein
MTIPRTRIAVLLGLVLWWPALVVAEDSPTPNREIREIRKAVKQLEKQRETDRVLIEQLLRRLDKVEGENRDLKASSQQHKEDLKQVQAKIESQPTSAEQMGNVLHNWFGTHKFTMVGDSDLNYFWNGRDTNGSSFSTPNSNSFVFDAEAIILYDVSDRLFFALTPSFAVGTGNSGAFDCAPCTAVLRLTDNHNLQLGRWDMPFNDYFEDHAPGWVKQTVDDPIVYQSPNSIVPSAGDGVQLRGIADFRDNGLGWVDYVAYVMNGPRFTDAAGGPSIGKPFLPKVSAGLTIPGAPAIENEFDVHRTKGYGARLRWFPLGDDSEYGLLRLGASTYDGQWNGDGSYYLTWGVSAGYTMGNFRARAEYIFGDRQLKGPGSDRRDGWYALAAYRLADLAPSLLGANDFSAALARTKLYGMYSGTGHRFCGGVIGGAGLVDCATVGGTPITQPRQYAIGFDYWITPSLAYKGEAEIQTSGNTRSVDPQVLTGISVGF